MKRLALLTLAFAGLVGCETPSAPTSRQPTLGKPSFEQVKSNQFFPVSGLLFNSCPPEEFLSFEGRLHVLVHGDSDPSSTNLKVHVNAQNIAGVGLTSGDRYRVLQNENTDVKFTPTTTNQDTDFRFRLIRQGSDDNSYLRLTFRFTFPPGTFEIIRQEIECRG